MCADTQPQDETVCCVQDGDGSAPSAELVMAMDGKERQALRISTARKPRLLAHTRASATCFSRNERLLSISLLKPMASSFLPLTFPFLSVQFRNTLRSAVKSPCLSLMTSGSSGSASSFPHTLWAGPAPPFIAWHSHVCVARLLHSSPFWSARSAKRLTRSDLALSTDTFTFQKRGRPTSPRRQQTYAPQSSSLPSPSCRGYTTHVLV